VPRDLCWLRWRPERGFTFDRYSGGKGLTALQEIVEKISYPSLRLDHLCI
jgi:hypothetical protein